MLKLVNGVLTVFDSSVDVLQSPSIGVGVAPTHPGVALSGQALLQGAAGAVEIRTPDGTALAPARAADPVSPTDLATKGYVDSLLAPPATPDAFVTFGVDSVLGSSGAGVLDGFVGPLG